jgi:hypothetical protein
MRRDVGVNKLADQILWSAAKKGFAMSQSVLEVLMGAQINLVKNRGADPLAFALGSAQLDNAIKQLKRNPDASAEFDEKAAEEN